MLILFLFHIHTPDCLRSLESAKQGKLRCLNRSFTSPWRLGSLSCPVNLGTALVGCGFAQFDSPTHRWPRWSDRCSWSKEGSFYWRYDFAASYKRDIERKGDEVVEWTEWKNESENGLFEEDWSFRWVEWTAPIQFNLSNIEITTLLRGSKFSIQDKWVNTGTKCRCTFGVFGFNRAPEATNSRGVDETCSQWECCGEMNTCGNSLSFVCSSNVWSKNTWYNSTRFPRMFPLVVQRTGCRLFSGATILF